MRIDGKAPMTGAGAAAPRREAGAANGARFSQLLAGGAGRAEGPAASAPTGSLDALLAIQADGDAPQRRRRQMQRGYRLLDDLDRIKAALLSGAVPTSELLRLAAALGEAREQSGDPGLDEVLAHIDLRAQVELAKLGRV
jgi:hypothetical protein